MSSFTDIFIKRPVFASVLSLLILVVGVASLFRLSIREYPKVDVSTVTVTTTYPGASAKLIEGFVTTPLESALSGIDGLDFMTSSSTQGNSAITLYFKLGYNINAAVADVSDKVNSTRWQLPQEINDPIVEKSDPNVQPSMYISFNDPHMNKEQLTDYLQRVIQPQLEILPGVGQAQILNPSTYTMRILLNPYRMAAHGITADDISNMLRSNNLQSPTGEIKSKYQQFGINAETDLHTEQQFNNLILKDSNGIVTRIQDIGHAKLGAPDPTSFVNINGKQALVMGIIPRSDANPVDISKEINGALKALRQFIPKGLNIHVIWDTSKFISSSLHEVMQTIIEAVIFVIVVIFLFLGSVRTLFIPAITIPLSLIGVCGLLLAMGFSINTLTLLAMVLAIGMVVDDAIVVSENIHRHLEMGETPMMSAIYGAREIRLAIIAMTLTLAAVYAPIGFSTGLTGTLFKEFAFTLAGAVIISGFVALTLSPMMCSKIYTPSVVNARFPKLVDRWASGLARSYKKLLHKILKIRWFVWIAIPLVFLFLGWMFRIIPPELAPAEDMGAVVSVVFGPASASLDYTKKYTKELANIFKSVPQAVGYGIINGYPSGVNTAIAFLVLKDWSERKISVDQVIQQLFPRLWAIPGIQAFPTNPFRLPGTIGFMPVNFVVETTGSYKSLNDVMQKLLTAAQKNPGLTNTRVDLDFDKPKLDVSVNRNKAGDMGITMSSIGNAINVGFGQGQVSRFSLNGRSYDVVPQLLSQFRNNAEAIKNLYVSASSGEMVSLSNLIEIKNVNEPRSLSHFQQLRSASLQASLAPGYSLGEAISFLKETAKGVLPAGFKYDFSGMSRQYVEASGSMLYITLFAIIFIFLILAAQFESFRDPLIILISVPLAMAGALLVLKLGRGTLNIYTEIGLLTLIGLISKHGILMVEFANQLQDRGRNLHEAIIEAASIRLRPILMTTAAMILGALPLALAHGAGAHSRHQMGLTIIGGMAFGTLLTLFIVPLVYTFLASKREVLKS